MADTVTWRIVCPVCTFENVVEPETNQLACRRCNAGLEALALLTRLIASRVQPEANANLTILEHLQAAIAKTKSG